MIGNELQQEIISLYTKDISSLYSINQIARQLGKTYPYINKKVSRLIKNKIFRKTIIGRSYLCSLNLKNDETIYLLILNEIRKKKRAIETDSRLQNAARYIEKIKKITELPLAIKTREKNKEKIIFVLARQEDKTAFERAIVTQALKNYSVEIIAKEEFLKKLTKDRFIQEHHIILHGYEKYYDCIREIEDELKLKYSKLLP